MNRELLELNSAERANYPWEGDVVALKVSAYVDRYDRIIPKGELWTVNTIFQGSEECDTQPFANVAFKLLVTGTSVNIAVNLEDLNR